MLKHRVKVKGKDLPRIGHEGPEGEQLYSSTLPSTSALDGGWVINATPRPLYPRERPGTHCRAGLWAPGLVWTGAETLAPQQKKNIYKLYERFEGLI